MLFSLPPPVFQVRRAARALSALLNDPDDLPQVFTLIEAMSGTAGMRLLLSFRWSESGARLLRERPDIVTRLGDRDWLRALPDGSLGRAYLAFVESEGISADGIREASKVGHGKLSDEAEYMRSRMRDTHDLWHAVTGYKGDVIGELSLLSFGLAQHWNSAIALIVVAGLIKGLGRHEMHVVIGGFVRGLAATSLPTLEWESLLALPLEDVRRQLKVGPPPKYDEVRTTQLRAEGLVA